MINRRIEKKIKSLVGKYPVISITGPRQSGKTTLVRSIFPDFQYVNFEEMEMREFATNDPKGFLNVYGPRVIIDEAQHVPEIFSYIQVAVDDNKKNQYILTGSQNFLLLEKITQSLAGRVAVFYLLPFSITELTGTLFEKEDYQSYMLKGGYPAIYDKGLEPHGWLRNYLITYVERDVRQVLNIGDLSNFQRFIGLCAGRIGQLVNFSSIANDLSVSYHTVQSWLSILETSFITFRLYPYYKNYNKRLVKSPKLYFYDTGLACSLLGIKDTNQLQMHYLKGELFENFVLSELYKYNYNSLAGSRFYFWRNNSGREIDCIIEDGMELKGLEIKSAMTTHQDFFKNLLYWQKLSGTPSNQLFLIYGGDESYKRSITTVLSWKKYTEIFD